MKQKIRLAACVAALLLIGGPAWAQSPEGAWSSYSPVPHLQPPNPPLAPPVGLCQMMGPACPGMCPMVPPGFPGMWAWAPVPPPMLQHGPTPRTTVAELMRLYRMLYQQGKLQEAALVAQQVSKLDPILGRTALALTGDKGTCCTTGCTSSADGCAECGARCGCCASCCTQTCQASSPCACKTCKCDSKGCKCGKGDPSTCGCAKGCKCQPAPKAASRSAGGCRHVVGLLIQPGMPGLPCPVPLPLVGQINLPSSCPVGRFDACAPSGVCVSCPGMPYPLVGCCGTVTMAGPVQQCATCARPSKPVKSTTGCAGCCVPAKAPKADASVSITAAGGRVCISSPAVAVECDRAITQGTADRVVLEGNVRVEFRSEDRPGTIVAERIALGLQDGTYEVNCRGCGSDLATQAVRCPCKDKVIKAALHQQTCPRAGGCCP